MTIRFIIDPEGEVPYACVENESLRDGEAVECVLNHFRELLFAVAADTVQVVYPIAFSPGDPRNDPDQR